MAQERTSSAQSKRSAGGSKRGTGTSERSSSKAKTSGSRSSRSSNGRTSKPRSAASRSTRKANASSRRRASSSRAASGSRGKAATESRSTLVKLAEKAKAPALAGGAAMLGIAGGVALSNGKKRNGIFSGGRSKLSILQPNLAKRLPKPNGSALDLLGDTATEVAKGSSKVGQLASQVQKAAEAISPESSSDD
jgi:hypothetical protein